MVRFSLNRWWRFVLTLCLLTVPLFLLSVSAPSTALADSGSYLMPTDPISPGGSANGDPDVPMGPGDGKSSLTWQPASRDVVRTVSVREIRCAGDVTVTGSVVVNQVRLLLLGLRGFYLGF